MTVSQTPAPAAVPQPFRKPPLPAREKGGSLLAGGVGFAMLSTGFSLFWIPTALLLFAAFIALFVGLLVNASGDSSLGFARFLNGLDLGVWVLPLVLAVLVGLALMVGSLFVSVRILRSRGVGRPWAVTWAGAGVSIVASWVVSAVLAVPLQVFASFQDDDGSAVTPLVIAAVIFSLLVGLAVSAAIGALSWWWMAHLMRPAARTP